MTDHVLAITPAAELLWRATHEFLRSSAADADAVLLKRMQGARALQISVLWKPTPSIVLVGADAQGERFAHTYELHAQPVDLN